MYELGGILEDECRKQYSKSDLKVKTILRKNLCVYEFYINKTLDGGKNPRFHLSLWEEDQEIKD